MAFAIWVSVPERPSVQPQDQLARADKTPEAPSAPLEKSSQPQPNVDSHRETAQHSRISEDSRSSLATKASSPASSTAVAAESAAPAVEATKSLPDVADSPSAPAPLAAQGAFGRVLRREGTPDETPVEIRSVNPLNRWRLMRDGNVQRSTDGGGTWESQDTGVSVRLTGGSSPSPSVCWLVGQAGTVLIQLDGHSWLRPGFPEKSDLVSVHADSEDTANVTTADGRTFRTTDGGRTWTRVPRP
jgi:hypothetical protein